MPKKKYIVRLSTEERASLQALVSRRSSKSQEARRAYVLLAADVDGAHRWNDEQISSSYGLNRRTVERWRQRAVEEGIEAAIQGKKPGPESAPRFVDGRVESQLIALRCSAAPEGYQRWTLRLLSDRMVELGYVEHISYETVRQVLKKTR